MEKEFKLSPDTQAIVSRYAEALNLGEEELIDKFLFTYLQDCKDIAKCPRCGKPLVWFSLVPVDGKDDMTCECGAECIVDYDEWKVFEK